MQFSVLSLTYKSVIQVHLANFAQFVPFFSPNKLSYQTFFAFYASILLVFFGFFYGDDIFRFQNIPS